MELEFQVWGFSSPTMFLLQSNFHLLVIHEEGVHGRRGQILSDNRELEHPMSSLWDYFKSLRCFPVMQLLFPKLIRARICLAPCVT